MSVSNISSTHCFKKDQLKGKLHSKIIIADLVGSVGRLRTKWFRLIMNISNRSRDLAWLRGGTTDGTNTHTCHFCTVCLTGFPFEFQSWTFTIGFYEKKSIKSELMIFECSFPLKQKKLFLPPIIIGSAEALPILCMRCVRWERERERERERDTEREREIGGSDITISR